MIINNILNSSLVLAILRISYSFKLEHVLFILLRDSGVRIEFVIMLRQLSAILG